MQFIFDEVQEKIKALDHRHGCAFCRHHRLRHLGTENKNICRSGRPFHRLFNLPILFLEKKLDQQLAGFFRGRPVTTQTVEIDEESVKVTRSLDPENPIEYDWSYINQIYEMPQYYMLMVGKGIPIIIDRSEEALLEGTKESLDAIIQEKAQLKPYKKTEEDLAKGR